MAGVTPKTRWKVVGRDSDAEGWPVCQWCGTGVRIEWGEYSLQHRRARGRAGTRLADANEPQNLVLVHGTATTGCHGEIEANPERARARGFRLYQTENPATAPIVDWLGREWRLNPDGTKKEVTHALVQGG